MSSKNILCIHICIHRCGSISKFTWWCCGIRNTSDQLVFKWSWTATTANTWRVTALCNVHIYVVMVMMMMAIIIMLMKWTVIDLMNAFSMLLMLILRLMVTMLTMMATWRAWTSCPGSGNDEVWIGLFGTCNPYPINFLSRSGKIWDQWSCFDLLSSFYPPFVS